MTKERLLVIDDEEGLRNFCKRALTKEGYEVEVSSSGEEALALMKEKTFNLALIDLKMPGIDGLEVLKRIKEEYPRTETMILTGYGSFESAVDALRLGADDYLTKPIDVAALLMAVKRCLEKRALKREIHGLKKLDKMKSEFINNISHELLGPISVATGAIDSIDIIAGEKKIKDENFEMLMKIMKSNTAWMGKLIKNLSDFSKIEKGKIEMNCKLINLNELLSDTTKEIEIETEHNGRDPIEIKIQKEVSTLYADEDKMRIALYNLLKNAIKYTPADGKITITAQEKGEAVEITISDTGIGISPEHHEKIFDKFYRVDSSLTQKVGGLGIGLSLVKKSVEVHNGRIWVESELNKGAKFIFTLPKGKPDG